jgi:hypothetical protein
LHIGGKEPSFWIIGGQEFDDAEPVLLILPVQLEIVFAASFPRSPDNLFPEFCLKTRDTQTIHRTSVPLYSLLLFTGHYGATDALQLLRDLICCRPFTTRRVVGIGMPDFDHDKLTAFEVDHITLEFLGETKCSGIWPG